MNVLPESDGSIKLSNNEEREREFENLKM